MALSLTVLLKILQGWRFAFFVVAGIAAAAAVVTVGLGMEPRLTVRASAMSDKRLTALVWAALAAAWGSFRAVMRVRTFQVLVLQVHLPAMDCSDAFFCTTSISLHSI